MGLIYFLAAPLTDALDGFLARKMNWFTELGKILDPIADKLLVIGTIFVLWANNFIPLYVFTILIGRDVLILLGAAMHMSLITNDAPSPNILGKITTGSQIFYIALCVIPPNSFALARTVEYFKIPRNVLTICLGKSPHAQEALLMFLAKH